MNLFRLALLAIFVSLGVTIAPATAAAQGTCRCNNGCHANPGQCVQGAGCAVGYAPFCGNRSGSCPTAGWVSCSGACMCVPIPNFDAGTGTDAMTSDVPGPGPDVVRTDVVSSDVPASMDVPASTDVPASMDVPAGEDVQPPPDAPPAADVVTFVDTPPPRDVQVVCPDGIIIDGICYMERCQYEVEIGLYCGTGQRCIADGDGGTSGICVPTCGGNMCPGGSFCDPVQGCRMGTPNCSTVTCPIGQFCDPASGCTSDRCGAIDCPAASMCIHNQCVLNSTPDAGTSADATHGDALNERDGTTQRSGCSCTTAGFPTRGPAVFAIGFVALLLRPRSRRRSLRNRG